MCSPEAKPTCSSHDAEAGGKCLVQRQFTDPRACRISTMLGGYCGSGDNRMKARTQRQVKDYSRQRHLLPALVFVARVKNPYVKMISGGAKTQASFYFART
jgi:hypothetical protein